MEVGMVRRVDIDFASLSSIKQLQDHMGRPWRVQKMAPKKELLKNETA
jgi:hypothetical protein